MAVQQQNVPAFKLILVSDGGVGVRTFLIRFMHTVFKVF
jgi:hypothetical protein